MSRFSLIASATARSRMLIVTAVMIGLCLLVISGCGKSNHKPSPSASSTPAANYVPPAASATNFNAPEIYKRVGPGVVTVVSLFGSNTLSDILGGGGGGGGAIGSGFVVSDRGEIITNAHVVTQAAANGELSEAREVYISFADSNQVQAKIVGFDPNADIALLKVDPKGLTLDPLPLGESNRIEVGIPVAAIGSPFNEKQSLSVGVVSGVDRSVQSLTNFFISGAIQTDAAINPGNSGGPLVVGSGQVIGVNQQIKSASGGGEGVGFAVPIDMVKRSLERLRNNGRVDYAFLGVVTKPVYPQLAQHFKLPVKTGAWIQTVTRSGPADKAGLRGGHGNSRFQVDTFAAGGDVITKVGSTAIHNPDDLSKAVAALEPNTKVTLEIWRGKARQTVKMTLGARPAGGPQPGH